MSLCRLFSILSLSILVACGDGSGSGSSDGGNDNPGKDAPNTELRLVFQSSTRITDLDNPRDILFSPDGGSFYIANNADGSMRRFSSTDQSQLGQYTSVAIANIGDFAMPSNGSNLYAGAFLSLTRFDLDATGDFTFRKTWSNGRDGVGGLAGIDDLAVSPDGGSLYAVASGSTLARFDRDATGDLTFRGFLQDGGRDSKDATVDGLGQATGIAVSPDNRHVYVTAQSDDSVARFDRDATGDLTFVKIWKNDITDGIEELESARNLAISPDGRNLYVTAFTDDALSVFERDASGDLLLRQTLKHNRDIDSFDGLQGVAVSPTGRHVYVTGTSSNALTVFERNASSDALTLLKIFRDGVADEDVPVDGLTSPLEIGVSPDGLNVYVTSGVPKTFAHFRWVEVELP